MNRIKRKVIAFVAALGLSGLQLWAAENISWQILWQVNIMLWLAGPGPIIGNDSYGKPIREGTPVHMLAALVGLFLGVVIYTAIFSLLIRRYQKEVIG